LLLSNAVMAPGRDFPFHDFPFAVREKTGPLLNNV